MNIFQWGFSQWNEMFFVHQRIIFQGEKVKIVTFAYPGFFLTASLRQWRWWWWWKKTILMGIGNIEFDIWRENLRRLDGWRLSRSHFVAQGQLFNKPAKCAGGERGEQKWVQNRRWTKIKCRWQKPFQWRQPCACSGNRVKDVIENKIHLCASVFKNDYLPGLIAE